MMAFLSEAAVELALLEQLRGLGYSIEREEDIGPDGHRPERESHDEVVLKKRFVDAVTRLNPGLPLDSRQDAIRKVMQSELPSLLEENRRIHKLMTEGVDVEYYADDGTLTAGKVSLIDFERPEQNDWLAVSQFVGDEGVLGEEDPHRPGDQQRVPRVLQQGEAEPRRDHGCRDHGEGGEVEPTTTAQQARVAHGAHESGELAHGVRDATRPRLDDAHGFDSGRKSHVTSKFR